MELTNQQIADFQETVWEYYRQHGRGDLPWRLPEANGSFDPYKIVVSELMLQQTQVARVVPKYEAFLQEFPTVQTLAVASLGDVLRAWQGLGYNRRAKFLWLASQNIVQLPTFPLSLEALVSLPGIGPNTAGAVLAYSYNQPVVFIETNIRTVYIHHFFERADAVADKEILSLVEQTLDQENTREFYWALMDYGTFVKAEHGNKSRASKTYTKQSTFHGSKRQIRGQIIRLLGAQSSSLETLQTVVSDERLPAVLAELLAEGLIREKQGVYSLD